MILDLSLPDMDGLDVIRALRAEGNQVPILILSGRSDLEHRLDGLAAGADDYLIKPFAFRELLLRLQAIARRSSTASRDDRLVIGDLVLNRSAHEVSRAGVPIKVAPKEFAVLEYLMEHPGQVLSRTAILERVWEYDYDGISNVVDSVIRRLRKAIDRPHDEALVETVHGMGYKIKADPKGMQR
ncbi:MAG: two-component system response regulator UczR [Chloroflexota bacterium]